MVIKDQKLEKSWREVIDQQNSSKPLSLLLLGGTDSERSVILADFIYRGIREDERNGIFVTFKMLPAQIVSKAEKLGWNLGEDVTAGRLLFIDASPSPLCEEIGACDTMSPLLLRLRHAIRKNDAKNVVIDNLQNIFSKISDERLIREIIFRIVEMLREMKISYIISTEKSLELFEPDLDSYLADIMVEIAGGKFEVSSINSQQK